MNFTLFRVTTHTIYFKKLLCMSNEFSSFFDVLKNYTNSTSFLDASNSLLPLKHKHYLDHKLMTCSFVFCNRILINWLKHHIYDRRFRGLNYTGIWSNAIKTWSSGFHFKENRLLRRIRQSKITCHIFSKRS